MEEIQIIDTPYSDRSCNNCANCITTELSYCLKNHAFVTKGKWCSNWQVQDRNYKFEN